MNTKKKVNVRALIDRHQEICARIEELADVCARESRVRTPEEDTEYEALIREDQITCMKMQAALAPALTENAREREAEAVRVIRENAKGGRKTEILFVRDMMMVSDVQSGGIIPLNVQDILGPLTEGFILDKVGLTMKTGLAGDFVWPMYEMVEAQVAGEGVALSDTKIPFSKMTASPERVGIAYPVTNQTLNQTEGVLESIIREIMPKALQILLNKIVFGLKKVNGATNLVGPFVGLAAKAVSLSEVPTFAELNRSMKAAVLETGIDGDNMCWVMTKSMMAILEGTPVNEKGIFIPMVQDGRLCGLPVYTTNLMRDADGAEYIGLGDWRYQPMGLFGSLRFIVDPYSQARKDSVDFVLNADYATKTLRPEAFKLGKAAAAAAAAPAPAPQA